MKILCVHPGASWSVSDVFDGLVDALRAQGHDLGLHLLDQRIEQEYTYLRWQWRRARKLTPDVPKPGTPDAIYRASVAVIEKALRHRPDVVFICTGMFFHPDALIMLRRAGCKIALLLSESPYDIEREAQIVRYADIAWTNERTSVWYLRQYNPNVHYLPHAYDPAKHYPGVKDHEPDVLSHDVVFVGTGWRERVELLGAVDWDGIDFGLYGGWDLLGSRHRLRRHLAGGLIDNRATAALYRRAKVGLNLHRTSKGFGRYTLQISHAESLNPRAYELAACGVFHLSDYRAELTERFGDVVPTFSDGTELERLIRYYLDHPSERRAVADRLPGLVTGHTFAERAQTIAAGLESIVCGQSINGLTGHRQVSHAISGGV